MRKLARLIQETEESESREKNPRRQPTVPMLCGMSQIKTFPLFVFSCLLAGNFAELVGEPRIVGGTLAGRNEYPYFIRWGGCGATLIYPDIALGAAHCSGGSVLHVGSTVRETTEFLSDQSISTTVDRRIRHPSFERATYDNDLVVLKLDAWIYDRDPVRLSTSSPFSGDSLTIIGFGLTSEDGSNSNQLLEGRVEYVDSTECVKTFENITQINPSSMICAEGDGVDACNGDSGGPLLDSQGRQIGVTSFGIGCARQGVPGVYSRIQRSWVEDQICKISEDPPASCDEEFGRTRQNFLRIDIQYDINPTDTSWTLRRADGTIVERSTTVSQEELFVSTFIDIDDGAYIFEIEDSFGDGFMEGE